MPKLTSKLQLTVPKAIADQFGIKPGDELRWTAAGEAIRVTRSAKENAAGNLGAQKNGWSCSTKPPSGRGVVNRKWAGE